MKTRRMKRLAGAGVIGLTLAILLFSVPAWAQMGGSMGSTQAGSGGMMGCRALWSLGLPQTPTQLTIDQAADATRQYLGLLGNSDLVLGKVIDFTNHFDVLVKEKSTGAGAFSLLVDKLSTGAVCFEPGPNMMWNTKYAVNGGHMMGPSWWPGTPTTQMPVSPDQAKQLAQSFLNAYLPGTTMGADIDTFYGFYDLYVLKDGQIFGMLSVDGYNGMVWYCTWHGPFTAMKQF